MKRKFIGLATVILAGVALTSCANKNNSVNEITLELGYNGIVDGVENTYKEVKVNKDMSPIDLSKALFSKQYYYLSSGITSSTASSVYTSNDGRKCTETFNCYSVDSSIEKTNDKRIETNNEFITQNIVIESAGNKTEHFNGKYINYKLEGHLDGYVVYDSYDAEIAYVYSDSSYAYYSKNNLTDDDAIVKQRAADINNKQIDHIYYNVGSTANTSYSIYMQMPGIIKYNLWLDDLVIYSFFEKSTTLQYEFTNDYIVMTCTTYATPETCIYFDTARENGVSITTEYIDNLIDQNRKNNIKETTKAYISTKNFIENHVENGNDKYDSKLLKLEKLEYVLSEKDGSSLNFKQEVKKFSAKEINAAKESLISKAKAAIK